MFTDSCMPSAQHITTETFTILNHTSHKLVSRGRRLGVMMLHHRASADSRTNACVWRALFHHSAMQQQVQRQVLRQVQLQLESRDPLGAVLEGATG